MAINTYSLGGLLRVAGLFANIAGTAIDPSVVKFKYRAPTGDTVTYTYGTDVQLVKDSVGNYHVDLSLDIAGTWHYKFYSTGTGQAADESQFTVDTPEI